MLPSIGTPAPTATSPTESKARANTIIKDFSADLKDLQAKEAAATAAVEAEGKRRDTPNQPIYALIYKGNQVVGYLGEAAGAFINGGIFDMEAMAQASQTPQGRTDWIEANAVGLTVKRFPAGTKAPKIKEANAMMNKTAAIWARENPIRLSAPEPDNHWTEMALRMKNLDLHKAQKLVSTEPQATAERWQRNLDWFKADHSA